MPRVARAPAIPPPPPLPVLSLVLTGQVYLVSVKKGETTNTQTSVGKQNGLVLFTEIFLNYRPSGIWGSYVDSPHLKPPTIHARGRFPGRSPLPTGDRPHQRPFSRMVTPSNRGPSTPEAFFPDGHPFQPGTVHARGRFPGWSTFGAGRGGARRHATPG